ncbi:hypothetical protein RP20_CCG007682 [Aedes albopictus]|nr:hypothetical protein RP20_CCG007682 [Aedes albopictus]
MRLCGGLCRHNDHELQASGIELSVDVVKAKILQDVKWPLKTSSEGALYTKQKPRQPKAEKKTETCFTCKKCGHFAENCPQEQGASQFKRSALCAILTMVSRKENVRI